MLKLKTAARAAAVDHTTARVPHCLPVDSPEHSLMLLAGEAASGEVTCSCARRLKQRSCSKHNHPLPESVVNMKPKYLPNLTQLGMPNHLQERIVLVPLLPQLHVHDAAAALELQQEKCPCFEIPRALFPPHAPLNKIIFLPPQLLPQGCDAGGVFGAGVLPRKYYPLGLMSPQQKGQTPPLFVGRRCREAEPQPSMPLVPQFQPPTEDELAETKRRLVRNDVLLAYIIAQPSALIAMSSFLNNPKPMQYNIYVPDLSELLLSVKRLSKMSMTVLSTVVHPHVPAVAYVTMSEESPKFELPEELFPPEVNFKKPVFLPLRYLPNGFDAGCVFAPGALPESLYHGALQLGTPQPQHNVSITPPLFLGRWILQRQEESYSPSSMHYLTLAGELDDVGEDLESPACTRAAYAQLQIAEKTSPIDVDKAVQQSRQLMEDTEEICDQMAMARLQRQSINRNRMRRTRTVQRPACSQCGQIH